MLLELRDDRILPHLQHYISVLNLPAEHLWVTDNRQIFNEWMGRKVGGSIGGAYAYHPGRSKHLILINMRRIDLTQSKALEIVVCEELLHMRHRMDGDLRRHAKHGYDRIAHQVSELTGASLEEVRNCLKPIKRRTPKYIYVCPKCRVEIGRSRTGVWSCGRCSPVFDRRYQLKLVRTNESKAA